MHNKILHIIFHNIPKWKSKIILNLTRFCIGCPTTWLHDYFKFANISQQQFACVTWQRSKSQISSGSFEVWHTWISWLFNKLPSDFFEVCSLQKNVTCSDFLFVISFGTHGIQVSPTETDVYIDHSIGELIIFFSLALQEKCVL